MHITKQTKEDDDDNDDHTKYWMEEDKDEDELTFAKSKKQYLDELNSTQECMIEAFKCRVEVRERIFNEGDEDEPLDEFTGWLQNYDEEET
jgi:hypothetical protein